VAVLVFLASKENVPKDRRRHHYGPVQVSIQGQFSLFCILATVSLCYINAFNAAGFQQPNYRIGTFGLNAAEPTRVSCLEAEKSLTTGWRIKRPLF
jgi:hypothetical protein